MKKITYSLVIGLIAAIVQVAGAKNSGMQWNAGNAMQEIDLLIDIYPNPTSEYLNIKQLQFDGSISQLEIIDLSGHTVYQVNEKFTQLSIYVGAWQKGIYMVFFRQGDKEIMNKIVVK